MVQAFFCVAQAQHCVVSGKITSAEGEPLPFASIRNYALNKGTLADGEGNFRLELETSSPVELEFRYVGYQIQKQSFTCDGKHILQIRMMEQEYALDETIITSDGRDPAYGIIRKAIDNRKYHLGRPNGYRCAVYIKGLQRLHSFPERILGMKTSLDSSNLGIAYLSESVSEFNLRRPRDIREIMISSKVSGRNNAFSYNQATDILIDYYESLINVYELSQRGFISPISPSAMLYYQYKLLGKFQEEEETIYKIQVIPKRISDPVFSGEIYIGSRQWRIHSTNLYLLKESGVEFVDTLRIAQLFVPVADSLWLPASQNLEFAFSAMGFRGNGHFITHFKDYVVNPEFPKGFFSKEVLKVESEANKRTEAYWDSIRPIPLTGEELDDYHKKDSIALLRESPAYLDSLDSARNRFDVINYLVSGHSWVRRKKDLTYSLSPLLAGVQFNTVEGLVLYNRFSVRKRLEKGRFHSFTTDMRYGFSSGRPFLREIWSWRIHGPTSTSVSLEAGHWIQQLDGGNPVPALPNTLYTLLDETNYLKLFGKSYGVIQVQREIFNGFELKLNSEYSRRFPLQNTTSFTLRDVPHRVFSSNNPFQSDSDAPAFGVHNAWTLSLTAKIVFANEYTTRPDAKFNSGSRWPYLVLGYRSGLPYAGAITRFSEFSATVQDDWDFRMLGKSSWKVTAGYFADNTNLYLMDFHHFGGNLLILRTMGDLDFQGLPYYRYSTDDRYVSAHFVHHFGGWFLNKIPLIRKLKLGEYTGGSAVWVPGMPRYAEWIAGLERFGAQLGVVLAWQGGAARYAGIRLGTRF